MYKVSFVRGCPLSFIRGLYPYSDTKQYHRILLVISPIKHSCYGFEHSKIGNPETKEQREGLRKIAVAGTELKEPQRLNRKYVACSFLIVTIVWDVIVAMEHVGRIAREATICIRLTTGIKLLMRGYFAIP